MRLVYILGLCVAVGCVGAQDPEQCPGGPPGITPGTISSSVPEAKGIDDIERCLQHYDDCASFIQEVVWRCETRYCCQEPCDCLQDHVKQQDHPCDLGTEITQLRCLVQHLEPGLRFCKWICCDGYTEHPQTRQCLITCEKNNGNCSQVCKNSDEEPHNAQCFCKPGYQINRIDPTLCDDENECLFDNGGCSDLCDNTVGGYECRCKLGRRLQEGDTFICEDIPRNDTSPLPVPRPSSQNTGSSGMTYIIIGVVGALVLLAILVLLLIVLCRRKKRTEAEPYEGDAYTNATYDEVEGRGQARGQTEEGHYDDTEIMKTKKPIVGAVGVDNPSYVDEKKKGLEAAGNHYEEIPYDTVGKNKNGIQGTATDGYEEPIQMMKGKKLSLPGAVDDDFDTRIPSVYQTGASLYSNGVGARPKQQQRVSQQMLPPEYSEIPTPGEVEADPRPPTYNDARKKRVNFQGFQDVRYDNMNNEILDHHVDIKDIKVKDAAKK